MFVRAGFVVLLVVIQAACGERAWSEDFVRQLQEQAAMAGRADWGHWGTEPDKYSSWRSHSNRLLPVYTFGMTLEGLNGANSVYRDAERLQQLYYRLPSDTLNPEANYMDQTDVYRLQKAAAEAGKKYIFLMVFDGLDWQTTQAAATYKSGQTYTEGRGAGLLIQDYRGVETDFGYYVCSPYADGVKVDVATQTVGAAGEKFGGYNVELAGTAPWEQPREPAYLIGQSEMCPHAYTDSAASATSLCSGIKTYNNSVNVDPFGRQVPTIAHELDARGFAIGVVTSVPISHATPACAYSNNVHRNDYQDLTRDLLGLPSVAHPVPLPGVDVLIGAGWGESRSKDSGQGNNFVPGNPYLTDADLSSIHVENGGKYVVAQRTAGRAGAELLAEAAQRARTEGHRLFGFFGVRGGHLPFATADGGYDPTVEGARRDGGFVRETYSEADRVENPTLAEITAAALKVLEDRENGFWLMVEPGDVDWANHANNIDNSIGAVLSGDAAFRVIVNWVEAKNAWQDTAVIVTSDHGHLLMLKQPEVFTGKDVVAQP